MSPSRVAIVAGTADGDRILEIAEVRTFLAELDRRLDLEIFEIVEAGPLPAPIAGAPWHSVLREAPLPAGWISPGKRLAGKIFSSHRREPFDFVRSFGPEEADRAGTLAARLLRRPLREPGSGDPVAIERSLHFPRPRAPRAAPLVVAFAPLDRTDDVSLLLEAFRQIRRKRPLRLLVDGGGRSRPDWETFVRDAGVSADVVFLGAVPLREKPGLLAEADLFLSTHRGGLGSEIIPAAACGLPIVALESNAPARNLESAGGCRIAPFEVDAVAARLVSFLDDGDAREAAGRRAREWSEAFDVKGVVDRFLEVRE